MWRYIFLAVTVAVAVIGFSIRGPELVQMVLDAKKGESGSGKVVARTVARTARQPVRHNPLSGRSARAKMGRNGHFYFNTRMNGTRVKVMVDTGASGVAINRSTARRLGIHPTNSDFKYKTRTANGIAYYASAMIDEIQIGRIVVNDVRAAVLKDSSLSQTLLGMTFLRKLRKFEVNHDTLTLTQ